MGMAIRSRPSNTVGHMLIRNHIKDHAAFEPEAIDAMSKALEKACTASTSTAKSKTAKSSLHALSIWRATASSTPRH